ncbi:hypothetical protein DDE18_06770 [Nocardioides gansuensis]|uniref:Circadian input-output histidine kinase CikA n=1 Tax=Nocardioides gansuensis TaxID=2138300 RepID=A0A2T8FE44_9ACTN|nr:ATP-binding protein [Nocardioides gansuensis]PVG83977.1 hypothetical protein DDE18_06770 [Nocardioides gansuensis]
MLGRSAWRTALDQSGHFYRQIVEWSRDGYWVIDPDGGTLFANERAAQLLGRTRAEMMQTSVLDVLDDAGRDQFRTHLEALREVGETPHEVECCYLRKDGSSVHLLVGESTVYDAGRPVAYVHRLTADADRQMLLRELSRSRDLLDEAQGIAKLGSWDFDMVTGSLVWSRELYTMFGVDPMSFVPTWEGFLDLVLDDDRALVLEAFEHGEKEGAFEFEARMTRRDGTIGWLHGLGRVTYDGSGGVPIRMQGTAQDITELKRTQLELEDQVTINTLMQFIATASNKAATLREALELIQQLLLAHPDWQRAVAFSVASDEHGRWLVAEPVVGHAPGPSPRELRTAERALEGLETVFEEDSEPQTPQIGFPVLFDGSPVASVVITAATPFERHAMLRSLVEQVAEQLARVVERETAARQLAAARDSAVEASRLKSYFLATVSHEIRTPMNGVIGLNDLLLRTGLDPRQRQLAEGVKTAGRTLLSVINNVLDFSKIEAGELELESTVFRPRTVVEQVLAFIEGAAIDREVSLRMHVSDGVPEHVVGDPTRFGQILTNLVGNAVKFTRHGHVFVRLDATGTPDGDVEVTVEVQDTGIGIQPEHLNTLFEPFRQADASTTRAFGGTGLGLAISRQLAEALGGRITVTSRPGHGSTFRFNAIFRTAAGLDPLTTATEGSRLLPRPAGRVLVAEDNEINQLVAVGLLESLGYTAEVVANGDEAVARATRDSYAAILMDLQMPTMDGYAATRAIRNAESSGARVPIIALTASATESERESCTAAGMDDFLTKPVQIDRLASVLQALIRPDETRAATAIAEPASHDGWTLPDAVLDPRRLDDLLEMGSGAAALVERAIDNFMAAGPTTLADLREAVAADDRERVRAAAHRLKGSALNLGATLVADLAAGLEEADRDLSSLGQSILDRLDRALDDTASAFQRWRHPPEP